MGWTSTGEISDPSYGRLYREVSAILYRHDPIGLAAVGAPEDEYDPETDTILPRLRGVASVDDLVRIIHSEFVSWFDAYSAGPEEGYREIAVEVWEAWRRYGGEVGA